MMAWIPREWLRTRVLCLGEISMMLYEDHDDHRLFCAGQGRTPRQVERDGWIIMLTVLAGLWVSAFLAFGWITGWL